MIHTSIEIAAAPERVRQTVTPRLSHHDLPLTPSPPQFLDFPAMPTWHSGFITSIAATDPSKPLEKGATISGVMGGVTFTAVILVRAPTKSRSSHSIYLQAHPPIPGILPQHLLVDRPAPLPPLPRCAHVAL